MNQRALDLPPGGEQRNPLHVRCGPCKHVWIAAYLPMELGKAGRLLKHARCPMCGADGKNIFLARDADVARFEELNRS